MADPVVGSVLGGKYLVEGILGQGGMGVVVSARHIDLDQRVAIKCLLAHAQAVPEIVERFTREARAAAKIHGEHVARVIDVGRFEDGTPFMVMEHLSGRDLADELAAVGPLPVHDAVRYLLETCEALVQAHALRIVHRDLKPSNLFLAAQPGRRPIVKVLDFGISKVIDPSGGALTKTSSVMGTPYYMSPEQLLSSKSVDERSDLWALGVILYELLTGRSPFYAETAPEVVALVLQNAPEPLAVKRPDVPPGLTDVIARCMRSKVDERFANVAELAQALAPFAAPEDQGSAHAISRVLGFSAPPPSNVPHSRMAAQTGRTTGQAPGTALNLAVSAADMPQIPKKRTGLLAAAAVAVAVAAIGGVLVLRKAPPPAAAGLAPAAALPPVAPAGVAQATAPVGLAPVDPPSLPAVLPAAAPSALAGQVAAPVAAGSGHAAKHAGAAVPPAAPAHVAAAAPPTVQAAPPPPAAAPAPPPAPAPAPAAPAAQNPLDMHIK